jgi:UDP-glucose 4-epimerase
VERALNGAWQGHEVFFITAPTTCVSVPSLELWQRFYPDVPIHGELSGHRSFYDCSKAERLLGWTHD